MDVVTAHKWVMPVRVVMVHRYDCDPENFWTPLYILIAWSIFLIAEIILALLFDQRCRMLPW